MDVPVRLTQLVLLLFVVHKLSASQVVHGLEHDHPQKPLHRGVPCTKVPHKLCDCDVVVFSRLCPKTRERPFLLGHQ